MAKPGFWFGSFLLNSSSFPSLRKTWLDFVDHILCKCKLFLSCSGLSGGFNFVLVYFLEYYFALFLDYMYVVLVKSLWAASIDGHVGYSGSLP